jgi:hypothetical protein
MRLHGRREIMRYLGRSRQNKNGWLKIREHYADVIRCDPPSGHLFALSEDLDRIDRERCTTMRELMDARGRKREGVAEAVGGYPRECLMLVKRLLGPGAHEQGWGRLRERTGYISLRPSKMPQSVSPAP